MPSSPPVYVTDTHALWWYLKADARLSANAASVFRQAAAGEATIIVPAIVVAELYFLSVKMRDPVVPAEFLLDLTAFGMILKDTGGEQLALLGAFPEIPDIHDRLIAAEAVVHEAVLITVDRLLAASPNVETLW